MKKIYFLVAFIGVIITASAQNVGIGTNKPNASAALEIKANNKGLLIPRTSTASRTAIVTPAKGLMVYDTTTSSFWFHNGTAWTEIPGATGGTNFWSPGSGGSIYNNNAGKVMLGTSDVGPGYVNIKLPVNGTGLFMSETGTSSADYFNMAIAAGGGTFATRYGIILGNFGNGMLIVNQANAPIQFQTYNSEKMRITPIGFVGINTTDPVSQLEVKTTTSAAGITHTDGTIRLSTVLNSATSSAAFGTTTNHPLNFFTANNAPQVTLSTTGNLGIGTETPTEKLTVKTLNSSYGISHRGEGGNMLATYMSGTSAGIGTFSNTNMRIYSNGVGAISILSGSNYVGIGVDAPTNKLQIGSVGNSGFSTNQLALGNGTAAFAIYQTNEATLMGATVDIILRPRNNGHGRVGINTLTPRASLDVDDNVVIPNGVFAYMDGTSDLHGIGFCSPCNPQISIIASYGVYASEFDAYSDARIKNITGATNSVKDLEAINAIQVKDYTMKDKVQYGNKAFKKVIAQEVEKVYPQIVSKHTDFIPNVYQATGKIEQEPGGLLLTFSANHNITPGAKKLRVMLGEGAAMQEATIVSIPSASQVIINVPGVPPAKAFVYGEQVDDFRTVDYEGLTTLNISATQQLSKLVKKQQAIIEEQNKKIDQLSTEMELMKVKLR